MTQEEQIERFKTGFPELDIVAAATVGKGIVRLEGADLDEAVKYSDTAEVKGRCKFVPASGAASRMFKDVFAHKKETIEKLADNLESFAFYDKTVFGTAPYNPDKTADTLLLEPGLGYGSKPKGVLKFHSYPKEKRTAFAEHLVEGAEYMVGPDGNVKLVFTVSPEHKTLFEAALNDVKKEYEERYHVHYDISFTFQDKETDTIAVTPDNKPFLKEDGTVLRRPAGHGALIYNLDKIEDELVVIKNIDNVCTERMLPTTALWKKALMGRALMLRDVAFGLIAEFDQLTGVRSISEQSVPYIPAYTPAPDDPYATEECQELCNEIERFLLNEFCVEMPQAKSCKERALALRAKLDRPIRVCGMVKNEGEPGGGPFVVRGEDGATSLQILESVQISDPQMMATATHFNPVDLVCLLKDHNGQKFNLVDHVDPQTGFISSKSWQGRELKALELPGLWNGAMSDWLTSFVEVPIETFNPVKVVLDLLKSAHQQ